MRGDVWHNWWCCGIPYTVGTGSSPVASPFIFFIKIGGIKMKRLIDWFRKPAIMSKLINTAGMFDGDFVVYKHHKYYVNCQTGVVIRVE